MLWKQVPEFIKHNTITLQINYTCHTNRKFPQKIKGRWSGGYWRLGKERRACLGMLLPSKAFLAEDAVSESVNWINACKYIGGKDDTNIRKKKKQSQEDRKHFLTPHLETSSLFKSSNFVHIAKSRKHLQKVLMICTSDSIMMIEWGIRLYSIWDRPNHWQKDTKQNFQIRNKCRMTPVHECVKIDLRKENDEW
jgi:hypothetical protein